MYSTKDSIKFMMAKVFFTLADFSYTIVDEITPPFYHGAETIEIKYIKSGSGKVIINNETHNVDSNYYIVIPEFISYSLIPDTKFEIYSIYLLIDKKLGFEEYIPMLKNYFVGKDKYDLVYLFDDLLHEFQTKEFGYNEVVVSLFKNMIIKVLRNENTVGKRISHWDTDSLQFEIEKILYNEFNTITIEDMSLRLHISVRELQRYLLKNYNKTFRELKNDAKMSFASNKLCYSEIKIADLATLVGYSTPEHFSYAFKEYFGMSPSKYKTKSRLN